MVLQISHAPFNCHWPSNAKQICDLVYKSMVYLV
jgi:hypothetical protein